MKRAKEMKTRSNKCNACGKPFVKHDGIERTCQKLSLATKALHSILTLSDRSKSTYVGNICETALKEILEPK